jgi:acyl-CoA thioesterase II
MMELEAHGPDTYVGSGPSYPWGGLYGGQIVAQALRAADLTVRPGHVPHSLHAYFLRVGDPEEPVRFEVERLRDGRSFVARQVVARQSTGAILDMSASFQAEGAPTMDVQAARRPEAGAPAEAWDVSWSPVFELRFVPSVAGTAEAISPSGPRPDGPEPWSGTGTANNLSDLGAGHVDVRRLGGYLDRAEGLQKACSWFKVVEQLGEEQALHAAALAYASDSGPAWVAAALHARECDPSGPWRPVSLDHAIWFHRPFRADDWLLFEASCASLYNSRGLTQGRVFSREGTLVASVAQEVFLRRPRTAGA